MTDRQDGRNATLFFDRGKHAFFSFMILMIPLFLVILQGGLFTGTITDSSAVEARVLNNGAAAGRVTGNAVDLVLTLCEGGNNIAIVAKDAAGNENTLALTVVRDVHPPSALLTGPVGTRTAGSVTLSGVAMEDCVRLAEGLGARVAKELDIPVVPVYIKGSHESWPRGNRFPRFYPIKVIFGRAVSLKDLIIHSPFVDQLLIREKGGKKSLMLLGQLRKNKYDLLITLSRSEECFFSDVL
jgi:hypothetical protein